MVMIDPFSSATQLAAAIRARKIGCRELLDFYAARVERFNSSLNAIIACDFECARARADEADTALARGDIWGPLHGIPMTVKESYDVEGFVTSWGSPAFREYRPPRTAVSIRRLIAAGANVFGKTNVPLFLGDLQTYNEIHGLTRNPWDLERTPGGSSGGSAASLAAGLTALEAGSDICSSIRTPSHYCGLFGHKPTFGLVSTRGQQVPGRAAITDIAVVGPMARSAHDLRTALQAMAGPDDIEGCAWSVTLPQPRKQRLADFRLAVLLDTPHAPVDDAVKAQILRVVEAASMAGATVDYEARPAFETEEADRLFRRLLLGELSGRGPQADFDTAAAAVRALLVDDDSPSAQALKDSTLSHRDWLIANEARHQMRLKWAEFFSQYDLLLCPAAATVAPRHNHDGAPFDRLLEINGKWLPLSSQFFWAGYAGLAYLPATVMPAGRTAEGLPVGVQIIGPQYGDLTCIEFARLLEERGFGFVPPSGY
jgi:amidase